VLMATADNQAPGAKALAEAGSALLAADVAQAVAAALTLASDGPRRHAMSESGRALMDGKGVERVAALITPD
jgi:spore coat polysaccharide biosynthesis predicted glycosyltransferase SpsG